MAKQNKPKQPSLRITSVKTVPEMEPLPDIKTVPEMETVLESEQLKEQFYELLLPEEYGELRQYLRNDGFLSNDEINAVLRDGRLVKEELAEKLHVLKLPSEDKGLQEKLTDYLWELHEVIQDPALEKFRADQLYRVETIQAIPDAERKTGEEEVHANQKKSDKSLEIVNGGLIANFIHNFKKTHKLEENPEVWREKKTRFQWQDVEDSIDKMGLSREMLAETGNLDRLLKGEKTGVIDFKSEYNGQETLLRGKIYLVSQGQEVKPYFQPVKQSLQVPEHKWGYTFSNEDKETLHQKGELGKQVELDDQVTGKKYKAYVGVDRETNSLTVFRADRFHTPIQIKGVTLSKEQQETLQQGGAIRLSGLTSENGQKYDADIRVSAGARSLSFSPPSEAIKQTIDVKTAKEMERSSDQLQGTSAGGATTKNKLPEQKQKKTEAKNRGIEPEVAKGEPAGKKESTKNKSRTKSPKSRKDQGLGVE